MESTTKGYETHKRGEECSAKATKGAQREDEEREEKNTEDTESTEIFPQIPRPTWIPPCPP
jgi:hypothetical protein